MKKKVLLNNLLFWSASLFGIPEVILEKYVNVTNSPIIGLHSHQFPIYELYQNIFGTIPVLQDKLGIGVISDNLRFNLAWQPDLSGIQDFLRNKTNKIRQSPEYTHVPELFISLESELDQLDAFILEGKKLTKQDKVARYESMKPTLKQIVAKVNEAIQEAVKETVYSSDQIEAAYIKLVQIGDVMELGLSEELSQEIIFDSKRLESDDMQGMCSTLIELRNALARDEELMTPLVEVRSRLGTMYRLSFPDYERVRTEAYYVLKLVRQKMGWSKDHLEPALKEIKELIGEMYQFPINEWKDMIPEIPWAHFKNMRYWLNKDEIAPKVNWQRSAWIGLDYKLLNDGTGNSGVQGFQLEKSLAEKWIRLCEIFETVYEKEPNEEAEELYRLLFVLGDFNLFYQSKQFLFFPWFDPTVYTRRCRMLHAGLHFFKSAVYSLKGSSFGHDMMHSMSECFAESKKGEEGDLSILNEASIRIYYDLILRWGIHSSFLVFSDTKVGCTPKGLACYYPHTGRTFINILRAHQYEELCVEKTRMTRYELQIFKHIERKIELMLDALNYRDSIINLVRLWELLDDREKLQTT